jgi:hypothetical protein
MSKIFISATSWDLLSYRQAVRGIVTTKGLTAVHQDESPHDYREISAKLRGWIAPCDAVICLVGMVHGLEPKGLPSGSRAPLLYPAGV